jgi:hypothetical protein
MSLKLYEVTIRGGHSGTSAPDYHSSFVVAESPDAAYRQVREFLDKNDLCFTDQREMDSISLLAEAARYPSCKKLLFGVGGME